MKYPSPTQFWDEWGEKIEVYWYSGNLEYRWLRFLRIHRNWWRYYRKE